METDTLLTRRPFYTCSSEYFKAFSYALLAGRNACMCYRQSDMDITKEQWTAKNALEGASRH